MGSKNALEIYLGSLEQKQIILQTMTRLWTQGCKT